MSLDHRAYMGPWREINFMSCQVSRRGSWWWSRGSGLLYLPVKPLATAETQHDVPGVTYIFHILYLCDMVLRLW